MEVDAPQEPGAGAAPFVMGGRPWSRPTRGPALAWATLLTAFVVPLPGLYRGVGSSMEEAFMLVFPRELAAGRLPNRDFLHLYGPGSLHVLAGWFAIFGDSLTSERTVGTIQLLAAVVAMFVLTKPWGLRACLPSALTMVVLLMTPTGLAALAWPGALAMSLWSLVFGVRALHLAGRPRTTALVVGGLLAGLAASYRPDIVVALGLAWCIVVVRIDGRSALRYAGGVVVGLVPVWIHLLMVGVGPVWRGTVIEPIFDLRPGRRLPVPPSWGELDGALQALGENPVDAPWWGLPALAPSQQLFLWFFVALLAALGWVVWSWWRWRHDGPTDLVVLLSVVSVFGLGIIGQAVQRPDSTHLAWGASIALSLVPVIVASLLDGRGETASPWSRFLVGSGPPVSILVVLVIVAPFYTFRPYLYASRVSVGDRPGAFEVAHQGKRFLVPNAAVQAATQAAVDQIGDLSSAGDRLFVGPADLSRTVYSDVMFYYLLPDLDPATYYIEMDPGIADARDSGLAEEITTADWLVLTNFWTGWYEPNASVEFGSPAPNQVVAADFCLIGDYDDGLVLVYERCIDGDGVDPSTIGIGPERRASMEAERDSRSG
jgi:hypothetical protein